MSNQEQEVPKIYPQEIKFLWIRGIPISQTSSGEYKHYLTSFFGSGKPAYRHDENWRFYFTDNNRYVWMGDRIWDEPLIRHLEKKHKFVTLHELFQKTDISEDIHSLMSEFMSFYFYPKLTQIDLEWFQDETEFWEMVPLEPIPDWQSIRDNS
jgi:hypothetical protein